MSQLTPRTNTMIISAMVMTCAAVCSAGLAVAHDHGGHKCKKGYVMTDDHRCVKKAK